jgi:predicted ATPase
LISGETGIGKTRLVKESEHYAEQSGFKILEGRCLVESHAPLLPFREALQGISSMVNDDSEKSRQTKIKAAMKKSFPHFMYAVPVVGPIIAGMGVAVDI